MTWFEKKPGDGSVLRIGLGRPLAVQNPMKKVAVEKFCCGGLTPGSVSGPPLEPNWGGSSFPPFSDRRGNSPSRDGGAFEFSAGGFFGTGV